MKLSDEDIEAMQIITEEIGLSISKDQASELVEGWSNHLSIRSDIEFNKYGGFGGRCKCSEMERSVFNLQKELDQFRERVRLFENAVTHGDRRADVTFWSDGSMHIERY